MLLTEHELSHYLLQRGLLTSADFVNRKITIRKNFSRNRNYLISIDGKKGFFVKQTAGVDYNKIRSIINEANCYWLANNDSLFYSLRRSMCIYFDYNPQRFILILQLIKGSEDFTASIARDKNFSNSSIKQIAGLLSSMHNVKYSKIENKPPDKLFNKSIPWIFQIDSSNPAFFNSVGNADRQILKIVSEKNGLINRIKLIAGKWKVSAFIHGDIRLSNFIASNSNGDKIKVIDWEMSDFGDPCWDVACFMHALLYYWITGLKAESENLSLIKKAAVNFMNIYIDKTKIKKTDLHDWFIKIMEFTAVRLIQTSKELADRQQDLQPLQIKIMQLSINILSNPGKAGKDLLGVSY